jgi:putative endonuclease
MPMDKRRSLGVSGEDLAAGILEKQGYQIIERNYRTPRGEIDLVARHDGALVFIEVKTRTSERFGTPQEAVHEAKQERLRLLAEYYLQQREPGDVTVRFDVVAILWQRGKPRVEIITAAF